jgi:hypothetical protein
MEKVSDDPLMPMCLTPYFGSTKVPRDWDTVIRRTGEISLLPDDYDEIVPKIRTISPYEDSTSVPNLHSFQP